MNSFRFFTVLQPQSPLSVRANFGPISARETIFPAQHTVSYTQYENTESYNHPHVLDYPDNHPHHEFTDRNNINSTHGMVIEESIERPKVSLLSTDSAAKVSGHVVTREVRRNSPVLRVLFYSGHFPSTTSNRNYWKQGDLPVNDGSTSICAVVIVSRYDEKLYGVCSPSQTKDGACVAEVTLPASWWPPVDIDSASYKRRKASSATVDYVLLETDACSDSGLGFIASQSSDHLVRSLSGIPDPLPSGSIHPLGEISLSLFRGSYEEVTDDNIIRILMPETPTHPNAKIYIPVCFKLNPNYPLAAFSIRIKIKSGAKVLGAQLAPGSPWLLSADINPKGNVATVTAHLTWDEEMTQNDFAAPKGSLEDLHHKTSHPFKSSSSKSHSEKEKGSHKRNGWMESKKIHPHHHSSSSFGGSISEEVFSWLIQVDQDINESFADYGRIVWQLLYVTEFDKSSVKKYSSSTTPPKSLEKAKGDYDGKNEFFDKESSKLTSRLDIRKDEIHSLIGVSKAVQMLNTAVLSGKQVSQAFRVFVVSQSGRTGDVTLQSNCHSLDESTLKVSPSCNSVYLDGSEIRGSSNATILIKYGQTYTGYCSFFIWIPTFPLNVRISDGKLSQIKTWKVVSAVSRGENRISAMTQSDSPDISSFTRVESDGGKSFVVNDGGTGGSEGNPPIRVSEGNNDGSSSSSCRLKYQQSYVRIETRFLSTDFDSGRQSSLLNRKISFDVTPLVLPFTRVKDARIAFLKGQVVEGLSPGKTVIQVVSPTTGKIMGSKELRVASDKETITQMEVRLVSGLQIQLEPQEIESSYGSSSDVSDVWMARITLSNQLLSQYQEALLDVRIHFSDGTFNSLSDMNQNEYHLSIDTFENRGVAYVPSPGITYPRIIAVSDGRDQLIHISLELPNECQKKRTQPLAMSYLTVDVDFSSTTVSSVLQNDAYNRKLRPEFSGKGSSAHEISSSRQNLNGRDRNPASTRLKQLLMSGRQKDRNSSETFDDEHIQEAQVTGSLSSLRIFELSFYAMMSVFSAAALIFMASCMVFAAKLRSKMDHNASPPGMMRVRLAESHEGHGPPPPIPPHANKKHDQTGRNGDDESSADEWVFLGRATLERTTPVVVRKGSYDSNQPRVSIDSSISHSSVASESSDDLNRSRQVSRRNSDQSDMRVTENPLVNSTQ